MTNTSSSARYILILSLLSLGVIAAAAALSHLYPDAVISIYAYTLIPAAAVILTMRSLGEKFKKGALKIGKAKDLFLAWTIGVGAALLAHIAPVLLGLGVLDAEYSRFTGLLEEIKQPLPQAPPEFFVFFSIMLLTVFLLPSVLFAFAEEFGFRGYLLPKLWTRGKFKALLMAGLVWGVWKAPVLFFSAAAGPMDIFHLLAASVLFGFILGWLYLRSKNIWAPSLASAAWQNSQVVYSLAAETPPHIINMSGLAALAAICAILYFSGEFNRISP